MIILDGLGSFFIGASLQSAMPVFAAEVGAREVATAYGVLLFATGAGGVVGGLLLEATGRIKPNVKAALVSTSIYLGFAITRSYLLAVTLCWSLRGEPGLDVHRPDDRSARSPAAERVRAPRAPELERITPAEVPAGRA